MSWRDRKECIVIPIGERTTYDFASRTFGHPTMVCAPSQIGELEEARKRWKEEVAKEERGEPFDALFVYGVYPEDWMICGHRLVRVGPRLWKR